MIRFDNVSMRYPGGYEALHQVSFELARGEMAFLTGHSGAGKSTLLKLATDLQGQGDIVVDVTIKQQMVILEDHADAPPQIGNLT